MEDINLHFTGDFNAVEKANNFLAAIIDNNIQNKTNNLNIDPRTILWKRVIDMNDRALRDITIGLATSSKTTSKLAFRRHHFFPHHVLWFVCVCVRERERENARDDYKGQHPRPRASSRRC